MSISPLMQKKPLNSIDFNLLNSCSPLHLPDSLDIKNLPAMRSLDIKNLPAMRETQVQSLGWEDPLEEGMVTHSSIFS